MDFELHRETLTRFAQTHLTGDEFKDHYINLKIEHSLRVFDNGRLIAEGEGFDPHTTAICHLASLYHDIGRFPQFARYGTFNDKVSVNHGRMGVLTLRNFVFPEPISKADLRVVRLAVGQHNIKAVKEDLPEPYATPVKTVRDADKIDIYRVLIDHFSGENPDPVVTHGCADVPGKYTPEIFNAVMEGRPGDYSLIQYANDFKLLLLGWLKDLNYSSSVEIILQRGSIDDIFSFLPKDEHIEALREKINIFIRYNYDSPS